MFRFLFWRRATFGYRVIPVNDDGTADEASRETLVTSDRLQVGDRIWRLRSGEWEVVELRRKVDSQGLGFMFLGERPSRLRWRGAVVVRRVG